MAPQHNSPYTLTKSAVTYSCFSSIIFSPIDSNAFFASLKWMEFWNQSLQTSECRPTHPTQTIHHSELHPFFALWWNYTHIFLLYFVFVSVKIFISVFVFRYKPEMGVSLPECKKSPKKRLLTRSVMVLTLCTLKGSRFGFQKIRTCTWGLKSAVEY